MKMLRTLRKTKGLTMKQLGEIIGVSESAISQYETCKREADFETLLKLSEELDCTIDYLLRGDECKKNPLTDERQEEIIRVLDKIGALTEDGDLSERGRQIITEFLDNNAEMLKKIFNEDA